MRGKLLCIDEVFELVRITPAHAGKTVLLTFTLLPAPDHPRACGENIAERLIDVFHLGSPPRMRGKRRGFSARAGLCRITPAHAGKTTAKRWIVQSATDHPRACGENIAVQYSAKSLSGSPPRMRGKLIAAAERAAQERITPAHAGKTAG